MAREAHSTAAGPKPSWDDATIRDVIEGEAPALPWTARLVALMTRLRGPRGCPWDRAQALASVRAYVLEEACELVDAMDAASLAAQGDDPQQRAQATELLCEELGDLLMQVAFVADVGRAELGVAAASADTTLSVEAAARAIFEKLVRRHPHVFGAISGNEGKSWDEIKAEEQRRKGLQRRGALDRVPAGLPPLARAEGLGKAAAKVGFDWPDAAGPLAKIDEELGELREAMALEASPERSEALEHELGDLLFSVVNLARHLEVDPSAALRGANRRFMSRFGHIEARLCQEGDAADRAVGVERSSAEAFAGRSLEELDRLWDEAKASQNAGD